MFQDDGLRLVLGSSSPWRRGVLTQAGLAFETASPDVDEPALLKELLADGLATHEIAIRIAEAKAEALLRAYAGRPYLIVAGDQLAEFRGETRCKPKDLAEGRAFLRSYRCAEVQLASSLAVVDATRGMVVSGWEGATVAYGDLPDAAIESALRDGHALRSCGAIVVENPSLAPFTRVVYGTPDAISGLPLALFHELCEELGARLIA